MGGTPNHPRERYTATLLSTLGKRPRILELGCGAGIPITRMLLDQGTSVTANDISTEQLELAKERCPAATSLAGDMLAMDLPLGSFDGVVSFFAIFHLPRDEQRAMFDKIYDWLADGGAFTFNVATTDAAEIKSDFLGMVMFWSSFGTQENEAMIRDAGFRILQVEVLEAGDGKLAAEDPDHATTFQWVLAEKTERT
ncbi:hypothetical protein KVT40_000114 [Elsinoe batatas]|uniref:Methyltransferase domain-containing protein n=1 Tax=Elsinoe batatas TaxID=2601811 RepID=A0A8K0PME9_9PEZI|nr:hypothetical protein KVT40_000114 [Elsinoe batatas]